MELDLRSYRVALALTALMLVGLASLGGVWVGSGGTATPPGQQARPLPDWFLPVWDAYDRNPEITPSFDFAGLYSPAREHVLGSADALLCPAPCPAPARPRVSR
jgi:hypothetical protein